MDLHFHWIGAELRVAGDYYLAPRFMDDGVEVVPRLHLENGAGGTSYKSTPPSISDCTTFRLIASLKFGCGNDGSVSTRALMKDDMPTARFLTNRDRLVILMPLSAGTKIGH